MKTNACCLILKRRRRRLWNDPDIVLVITTPEWVPILLSADQPSRFATLNLDSDPAEL